MGDGVECACRFCGRVPSPAAQSSAAQSSAAKSAAVLLGRRAALAGLVGLPLVGPVMAWAQVASEPEVPGTRRPADWTGPGYARGMAAEVTGALVSLVQAYGSIANQIDSLQAKQRELAEKLAAAVRDKARKMDEYRAGLFCSGCGQTKSEILAKGEQFPHSGQRIIEPTPEQIAAKERELQGVIDRLADELKKTRAKLDELDPQLSEIKTQLFAGMGLWRSANVFERRLIRQEDSYDAEDYLAGRARITRDLTRLQKAAATVRDASGLARTASELETSIDALKRAEAERSADLERVETALAANNATAREQVARLDSAAKTQASKITASGQGGYLQILSVLMTPNVDPRPLTGEATGHTFRMGRYSREGWGEMLPRVAEFLGRARNLQLTGPRGSATSASVELSRAESTLVRLKTRVAAAEREAQRLAALEEAKRKQAEAERQRLAEQAAAAPPTN